MYAIRSYYEPDIVEAGVIPVGGKVGTQPACELIRAQKPNVLGVDGIGFFLIKARGIGVDIDDVERARHLV